jgi:hypothetical protein
MQEKLNSELSDNVLGTLKYIKLLTESDITTWLSSDFSKSKIRDTSDSNV